MMMNDSEQDSEVTFGGVAMTKSKAIPEAEKEEDPQEAEQSDSGTEAEEDEEEIILTGQQWADRAFYVLHSCLDNPDSDYKPHQPQAAHWREQGFRKRGTLLNALQLLVRDGRIEEKKGVFRMPERLKGVQTRETLPKKSWSEEIADDLPLNLPFTDVRRFIYQPDTTKRVPNELTLTSLTGREKCQMLRNRLMINGLNEKFWYEPPFDWLEHFGVTLAEYAEVNPKPKARRSSQVDEEEDDSKAEEEKINERIQPKIADPVSPKDSVQLSTSKEKQFRGKEMFSEPGQFNVVLGPLGEKSSRLVPEHFEFVTGKPTTSRQPQNGTVDGEAKTRLLLSTSQAQIAYLAEQLKKSKIESTKVAATLMRNEKERDAEEEGLIRRHKAVEKAQEKKEQMYAGRMEQMEADLKQALGRSQDEQRRRALVETQLQAQTDAVKKFFSEEPYQGLNSQGQRILNPDLSSRSRDAHATASAQAACRSEAVTGLQAEPEGFSGGTLFRPANQVPATSPDATTVTRRLGCFQQSLIGPEPMRPESSSQGVDRGLSANSSRDERIPQLQRSGDPGEENVPQQRSGTQSLGLQSHSMIAPAAKLESIVVPDFAGDKRQFEHWTQQLEFYLSSTKVIHESEEVLCHFLLSHLKKGSPPAIAILSVRERRSVLKSEPAIFIEEMIYLCQVYAEENVYDVQRILMKIITERDAELGAHLQEQIDRKVLPHDDPAVLKEFEAWEGWDAIVRSHTSTIDFFELLLKERESQKPVKKIYYYKYQKIRRGNGCENQQTSISGEKSPDFKELSEKFQKFLISGEKSPDSQISEDETICSVLSCQEPSIVFVDQATNTNPKSLLDSSDDKCQTEQQMQQVLTELRDAVKIEKRRQELVETELRVEAEAVQRLLSLRSVQVSATIVRPSEEPDSKLQSRWKSQWTNLTPISVDTNQRRSEHQEKENKVADPDDSIEERTEVEEKDNKEQIQPKIADPVFATESVQSFVLNKNSFQGKGVIPEPGLFNNISEPLGEKSSGQVTECFETITEKPIISAQPQNGLVDDDEVRTQSLLNTSQFQVAFPARRFQLQSKDHTEQWKYGCNPEKQSKDQVRRASQKRMSHRKRVRKKAMIFREYLFQGLRKISRAQDHNYKTNSISHRKRVRKKRIFLLGHLFQGLGEISKTQDPKYKTNSISHRKRARKKRITLSEYLFQGLGKIPRAQDQNYKINSRDLKLVPETPLLLQRYFKRIETAKSFDSAHLFPFSEDQNKTRAKKLLKCRTDRKGIKRRKKATFGDVHHFRSWQIKMSRRERNERNGKRRGADGAKSRLRTSTQSVMSRPRFDTQRSGQVHDKSSLKIRKSQSLSGICSKFAPMSDIRMKFPKSELKSNEPTNCSPTAISLGFAILVGSECAILVGPAISVEPKQKEEEEMAAIAISVKPSQRPSEPIEIPTQAVNSDSKVSGTTFVSEIIQFCDDAEMSDATPKLIIKECSTTPSAESSDLIVSNSGLSKSGPTLIICSDDQDTRPTDPSGESASSAKRDEGKLPIEDRRKKKEDVWDTIRRRQSSRGESTPDPRGPSRTSQSEDSGRAEGEERRRSSQDEQDGPDDQDESDEQDEPNEDEQWRLSLFLLLCSSLRSVNSTFRVARLAPFSSPSAKLGTSFHW